VRHLPPLLIVLVSFVSLAACADRLDLPFSIGETGTVTLFHEATVEEGAGAAEVRTSTYRLARNTEVPPPERDFAVVPAGGAKLRSIRVFGAEDQLLGERELSGFAELEDDPEFRIALPAGSSIARFDLTHAGEIEGPPFSYVGLREHTGGVVAEGERVVVGTGAIEVSGALLTPAAQAESRPDRSVKLTFREPPSAPTRFLAVTYTSHHLAPVRVSVACSGTGGRSRDFELTFRPGRHTVYLHEALLDCVPGRIDLDGLPGSSQIEEVVVGTTEGTEHAPIPSDLGIIGSFYPQSAWRQADYELFAWSLYPEVLVFDTRSYEVQSSFFKRLAFFVEKRGFRGEMLSDAELAGRHGWNAHNYRPEGLARFYNVAAAEGVALTDEEMLLREILLANGVLRPAEGRSVAAGTGGILSVSQESYPVLRELLLAHEAYHGAFYANTAFRDGAFAQWESLSQAEREFWRRMLSYLTYDPSDRYLMVNEFQAYLLQQRVDRARGYLRGSVAQRLDARRGDEYVDAFLEEHPRTFEVAARRMDELLFQTTGLEAGDVYCVR
jgi:hypothetical protein